MLLLLNKFVDCAIYCNL
jgi:hypothetical protein